MLFLVVVAGGVKFSSNKQISTKKNIPIKKQNCVEDSCVNYQNLNDRTWHYYDYSLKKGVGVLTSIKHIKANQKQGRLQKIITTDNYVVDTMTYSYPFLCLDAINFLEQLSLNFRQKLKNTNLQETRFYVTSAVRTTHSVKLLRKRNRNASKYSAHLHGTTFDIGYDEFHNDKVINELELNHLKDLLAQTLIEFKLLNKCWVTYEQNQKCFHIVTK